MTISLSYFPVSHNRLSVNADSTSKLKLSRDNIDFIIDNLKKELKTRIELNTHAYTSFALPKHIENLIKTAAENIEFVLKENDIVIETYISFNQSEDVIKVLNERALKKYNETNEIDPELKELYKINIKFSGLCELICNKMLMDDLLGKGNATNFLKNEIKIETLNVDSVKKSHLLNLYSIFERFIALLFKIYPHNLFSITEQWNLVIKTPENKLEVNKELLKNGLKNLANEETLKLEVFSRDGLSFSGHSLLVKKIKDDDYIFFDPNKGEYRGLSYDALTEKINEQLAINKAIDMCFIKGRDYLKKLQEKRIFKVAKLNTYQHY